MIYCVLDCGLCDVGEVGCDEYYVLVEMYL